MTSAVQSPAAQNTLFAEHAIRAFMLLDARSENAAFRSVDVTTCACRARLEDPSIPTVAVTLAAGELEHTVIVHLGNSWIGSQALDDQQVEALHSACGLQSGAPSLHVLSRIELPVEELNGIELHEVQQHISSTPGRGELRGTLRIEEDGPLHHLHMYFASGSVNVITYAYGEVSAAGTTFPLATEEPRVGGYKIIVGSNIACRHFAGVTPAQARALHEEIVAVYDSKGAAAAAQDLRRASLAEILESDGVEWRSFSLEQVRMLGYEPLEMTDQEIEADVNEPACVTDIRGFSYDSRIGRYHYSDFMIWHPKADDPFRKVCTQAVVVEGADFDLSEAPQETNGYVMQIGNFGDPIIFENVDAVAIREIHAEVCERLVQTGSTRRALDRACALGGNYWGLRHDEE